MRVYLTGFMGAGKTVVGALLAQRLETAFIDLDAEIEARAGQSVREIFESRGEAAFRALEHTCLAATGEVDAAVVATGGGTVTFTGNRSLIRQLGTSVWLAPGFDTIMARLGPAGKADRPLLRSPEQAFALYRQRLSAYRMAEIRVDIARDETPREVAARIDALLRG